MASMWGSFAAHGIPIDGTSSAVEWPAYDGVPQGQTLVLSVPESVAVGGLKAGDCAFWDTLLE